MKHTLGTAVTCELRGDGSELELVVSNPLGGASGPAVRTLVEHGADVVEIGIPYTDPVMDGTTVQRAVDQALRAGARVRDAFRLVRAVAEAGAVPLVMTYWNPVLAYGVDAFARDLAAAGGAGLITPDLIPDEAAEWIEASERHGLDRVFLVAPSSTPERLQLTARASRGFVYAASTMGVTGERATVGDRAEELVERTRERGAELVCVGLGVSNGDQAAQVGRFADGVIVGSAFVRPLLGDAPWPERLTALGAVVEDLAAGVHRAREGAPA